LVAPARLHDSTAFCFLITLSLFALSSLSSLSSLFFSLTQVMGGIYTYMAVKRYQIEERGEEEFSLIDEMKWAFLTPSEE